eukprot:6037643-Prymnesium_polylepis.1
MSSWIASEKGAASDIGTASRLFSGFHQASGGRPPAAKNGQFTDKIESVVVLRKLTWYFV